MKKEIIVIPDVHGRDFWQEAIPDDIENYIIVFLGDYLDPYEDEDVDWWGMWERFDAIINLKRQHPENVILLLGNHDLHYVWRESIPRGDRYNIYQQQRIADRIVENWDLFQIAYETTLSDKKFLFTHAGVSRFWLQCYPHLFPIPDAVTAETLNHLLADNYDFMRALGDISPARGGSAYTGSPIWADEAEMSYPPAWFGNYVQVFGHTMGGCVRNFFDRAYCVDCRNAIRISEECLVQITDAMV